MRAFAAVLLVLACAVLGAGSADAESWTAVFSQEAHSLTTPPSGAGISLIDLGASPAVGSTPFTTPNPFDVVITPDARTAYVASFGACGASTANLVQPIDMSVSPPVARAPISLGAIGAFGIAVSPDGRTVYASGCGKVVPIDVSASPVTPGTPIDVPADPFSLLISRDGHTLWTANHSTGNVSVIDLSAAPPAVVRTIAVGARPLGMALTPDGTRLYVANGADCTISVIATASETVTGPAIALPSAACTGSPQGYFGDPGRLVMSPDGATLYAASVDKQVVTPVDTATNVAGTPISFAGVVTPRGQPFAPGGLAMTPDGARLLVADASGNSAAFGNSVQIVSTPANTLSGAPIALNSGLGFGLDGAVTPDQAPVADFTVTSAPPGSPTHFDASTSTVRYGTIASYAWDFGDGSAVQTTTTPTTEHAYGGAGTFSASVTETTAAGTALPATTLMTGRTFVRNGNDSARASRSVIISAVPQPAVTLSTSSLDFGSVGLSTSATRAITLTNAGSGALTISGSALSGGQASDFTLGADRCTGQVVAAGATCAVTVNFLPPAAGLRTAQLAFTDNASGSPHTLALTGRGTTSGTVTGTVKDGSRAGTPPLPGAALTLCRTTLADCTTASTDGAGGYRFTGVSAGSYVVTINPPSGSTLGQGSRLAEVVVGQTTDATTILRRDAPLPAGVTISSGTGSVAGGHPVLYWDAPFAIDVPPLKAPGARGTPNSTVSSTVVVALRTAGSGQTVIGSALTYSVSYDASGAAVRAVATRAALPGVIAGGFDLTLGDTAVPARGVTLIGGAGPATTTQLRASSDGLRRLAHGALELTVFAHRSSGNPTARGSQGYSNPNCVYSEMHKDQARIRVGELSLQLAELEAPDPGTDALFGKPDPGEIAQLKQELEQAQQDYAAAQQRFADDCGFPDEPNRCPADDNIFAGDSCNPGGPVAVDPSGYVRTRSGVPLENARVVLERSDTARGPYVALPKGDQRMAPNNRRNPDATDIDGHFGWDVFPGYYRVRATRKGCRGSDTSKGLPVPPPVTNLRLTLSCPNLRRAATHARIVSVKRRGPSTVATVQVSSRRKPTGLITLSAPGLGSVRGFVDVKHPRATLVLAGHLRKHARLVARYAGNARWLPSSARNAN